MVSNICDSFQILGNMDNERTPLLLASTKESYSSSDTGHRPRPLIINVEVETESIEQVRDVLCGHLKACAFHLIL